MKNQIDELGFVQINTEDIKIGLNGVVLLSHLTLNKFNTFIIYSIHFLTMNMNFPTWVFIKWKAIG